MITKGRNSYIRGCQERFNPDVTIGNFCSMASVTFHGQSNHKLDSVSSFPFLEELGWDFPPNACSKGKITIGNDVWIGDNVTILSGVTIGDGVAIGCNSVVASDLDDYGVYVGNPAKLVRYRFDNEMIEALLKIKWWDWDDEKIKEVLPNCSVMALVSKELGKV